MPSAAYALSAAAAPVLVYAEDAIDRVRGRASARGFGDRIEGASHVVGEAVLVSLLGLDVFAAYEALVARVGLLDPSPASPLTWIAAFLALDFAYYAGHRACHRVALLWALHAVHHQQRGYGLSVGLRGPWLSALQIAPFMVPLAVLGLPAGVLFPIYAAHTAYKLLVHVDLRRRLGPVEGVAVTPASHRVHHSIDASCTDKNFGGVLAIWDRLFGTWRDVAGVAPTDGPELATLDPLANNVAPIRALFARARRARGARAKLGALFGPPAHEPVASVGARHVPAVARASAWVRLFVAAAGAAVLVAEGAAWPAALRALVGVVVVVVLSTSGRRLARASGVSA